MGIEDYVNGLAEDSKKHVLDFIAFMKSEFPNITPKISFAMPMWWLGNKMYDGYVAVSAAQKHYSIHFHNDNYLEELKNVLPNCKFGRKCVNIKYGDENSISIVKKSVRDYFNSAV